MAYRRKNQKMISMAFFLALLLQVQPWFQPKNFLPLYEFPFLHGEFAGIVFNIGRRA